MANFNTLIKRKQYIWLGLILAGGAAAVGGGLYLSDLNMSSDEEAPAQGEPAPDMTGVVDSSFNSKVEQHATTEMQATAADLNKRFDSLQGEVDLLSKARTADQIRIDKLSSDNEAMQTQLKALGVKPAVSGGEPAPTPPSPPPGPEGEPQPASYPPQTGAAVPPPTAFYPGNGMTPPPQVSYQSVPVPNQIQRKTFSYDKGKKTKSLPYIPSGSFAKSMLIEGADANASVTGNESTVPMQLRIT
ncbi:F-type conjugal transfer pilus assembly protein TraB, partial [Klebsiella pneumoniae]|nr:conjugal transfer protein TraB [Klebsiella pneumoniae]HBR4039425.1 conjugal transfer protein TraB [Klebsiella pneumoniae]HBS0018317.1 conjugal transfer protein TraB [Klebsiella pneumoniae]HBS7898932.1 conjugal transfer protein TraB [Klebsiella pneumoniae]HBS8069437.1 conjugal transfer protein TraB [Klebsiella pneumoniae]